MKSLVTFFNQVLSSDQKKTIKLWTNQLIPSIVLLFLWTSNLLGQSYCASKGSNSSYMGIERVTLNTINNTSGDNGGYKDFTSLSTNLAKGNSYDIAVLKHKGFTTSYPVNVTVWIDLNKNGNFSDEGERLLSIQNKAQDEYTGTIAISNNATSGNTRMRVSLFYYSASTTNPCLIYSYGEVEDYTVNIQGGDTMAPTAPTSLSASSIQENSLTLRWLKSGDNVGVTGYDIYRNNSLLTSKQSTTDNTITHAVTGLSASTTYSFYVIAKDAAGNRSVRSNTISATTASGNSGGGGGGLWTEGHGGIYRNGKIMANGEVYAKSVTVQTDVFADYVFDEKYPLLPLTELEQYIQKNHHLPNIPKAKRFTQDGINVSNLFVKQMEKIEELTLYILKMDKRIKQLEKENLASKE